MRDGSKRPACSVDARCLDDQTRRLAERFGLAVSPEAAVWKLSVGEKQRVEILRTLARGANVLILDEPTASLVPAETAALFELIEAVQAEDKTIVFISHKFQEVLAIADRVTVMRKGRVVGDLERAETNPGSLTEMVVGGEVNRPNRAPAKPGDDVIVIRNGSRATTSAFPH